MDPIVIPIIAICGGFSVAALHMLLKYKADRADTSPGELSRYDDEIEALKARVAALETLATDSKEQLKREIDGL